MNIKSFKLKSNGWFSIVKEPYDKKRHPNQQQGLDKYVDNLWRLQTCLVGWEYWR